MFQRNLAAALVWLLCGLFAATSASAAIPDTERAVLVKLYNQTNGAGWDDNSHWNVTDANSDPCDAASPWFGITCDTDGNHVTGIALPQNGLDGTLPSLQDLSALQDFSTENSAFLPGTENTLAGVLPDISGLTALRSFNVSGGKLTGQLPATLANLSDLRILNVNSNQLDGEIPPLAGLTSMRKFSARSNQLTGAIPELSNLASLELFDASYNQLTGEIPMLAGLERLDQFVATGNKLTGAISPLRNLPALRVFGVNDNQLTGSIPLLTEVPAMLLISFNRNQLTGPIPALDKVPNLINFRASENQLTGPIPALDKVPNLLHFDASENQLTGPVPSFAALPTLWTFEVDNNQLSGEIPDLSGLDSLLQFRVENNNLTGPLPLAPASLEAGLSKLCKNYLTPSLDAAWNLATGETAWYTDCLDPATAPVTHTVTATAGSGGSVWPALPQTGIPTGVITSVSITPDTGFALDGPVTGSCGGTLAGNTFTVDPVTADCSIIVNFAALPVPTWTVTPNVGSGNGSISPSTPQTVNEGDTMSFVLSPDAGWQIDTVSGCGGTLVGNTYTTAPVTDDCAITVTYVINATPAMAVSVPTLDWRGLLVLIALLGGLAMLTGTAARGIGRMGRHPPA